MQYFGDIGLSVSGAVVPFFTLGFNPDIEVWDATDYVKQQEDWVGVGALHLSIEDLTALRDMISEMLPKFKVGDSVICTSYSDDIAGKILEGPHKSMRDEWCYAMVRDDGEDLLFLEESDLRNILS